MGLRLWKQLPVYNLEGSFNLLLNHQVVNGYMAVSRTAAGHVNSSDARYAMQTAANPRKTNVAVIGPKCLEYLKLRRLP